MSTIADLILSPDDETVQPITLTVVTAPGNTYTSTGYISMIELGDPVAVFSMKDHRHGRKKLTWAIEFRGHEDLGEVAPFPDEDDGWQWLDKGER